MGGDHTVEDTRGGGPNAVPPLPGVVLIAVDGEPRLGAVALERQRVLIGRGDHCGVVLDERASLAHAELGLRGGAWLVRDLGSRNGTFVDGQAVVGERTAAHGAIVRAGRSLVMLCDDVRPFESSSAPTIEDGMVIGPQLRAAFASIAHAAPGGHVMILGETGTGKEYAAQRFHAASGRPLGPMIAVNCAAIPDGVADAVLFGSRRGAFSGAVQDRVGLVEAADGGTLFLDEIGELDLQIQSKLLRVLETHEVLPVGETRTRDVDFRLCAATHRDVRSDVSAGRFREDLYFRVARPSVSLPPLRERREDIVAIAVLAIDRIQTGLRAHISLLEACCIRTWPGNVRELLQELGCAALAARARGDDLVRLEDLPDDAGIALDADPAPAVIPVVAERTDTRDEVVAALAHANGNVSAAARALALHRTQLYRLMRRFDLA